MKMMVVGIISVLMFVMTAVLAQQECQGIKVLYPKAGSIMEHATTYLILGNTNTNNRKADITKVSLFYLNDQSQEIAHDVWTGQDELLQVSAIQHDLTSIQSKDLPNSFWYRIMIQLHDGTRCQHLSGKFEITTNV